MNAADVRLDAATLEWVAEQMRSGRDDVRRGMEQRVWMGSMAASLDKTAAEARDRQPAFSDWIRATEGTGLGEPLSWWDDGVDGGLEVAACWQHAGRRVVAYMGPKGLRYVEVDGKGFV